MNILKAYGLVSKALKASHIPHALAGGMATNLLVVSEDMRETHDVDFALATVYPDPVSDVIVYLMRHQYYNVERLPDSQISKSPTQTPYANILKIVVGGIRVDFVVLRNSQYVKTAIRRAWRGTAFSGLNVTLLSPEDVFLYKALAGRPKDLQPMSALSQIPRFNWEYVTRWSRLLGVSGLVKKFKDLT